MYIYEPTYLYICGEQDRSCMQIYVITHVEYYIQIWAWINLYLNTLVDIWTDINEAESSQTQRGHNISRRSRHLDGRTEEESSEQKTRSRKLKGKGWPMAARAAGRADRRPLMRITSTKVRKKTNKKKKKEPLRRLEERWMRVNLPFSAPISSNSASSENCGPCKRGDSEERQRERERWAL